MARPESVPASADPGALPDRGLVGIPLLDAAVSEVGTVLGRLGAAAVNVVDRLRDGHLADTRRLPRTAVTGARGWTLHRYAPTPGAPETVGRPVLLVPPLGAPDLAFDLRRGHSLVEFLLDRGRAVYVVTYDAAFWRGRRRGLETWVDEVVPAALRAVSAEGDDESVHVAGWSLGGLFALLTVAGHRDLAVASVTAFAAPVDVDAVPIVAPFRSVAEYTGGQVFTTAYRLLGGLPAPAVRAVFQLASVDRYVTKPLTVLTHLDDRELLEQMEAVDIMMRNMTAYPGRAFGQIYHHVIRGNEIATGTVDVAGRPVRLADIDEPVLLIAGAADGIAPVAGVRRGLDLLTGSSDLRFAVEPGGHLGVLAGRGARSHSWLTFAEFMDEHDALRTTPV